MNVLIRGIEFGLEFIQYALFLKLVCDIYRVHKRVQILVCAGIVVLANAPRSIPDVLLTGLILCLGGWVIIKEESFAIISMTFFYIVYRRCYEFFLVSVLTLPNFFGRDLIEQIQRMEPSSLIFIISVMGTEILALFLMQILAYRIRIVNNKMLKMFFASLAGYAAFYLILPRTINIENDILIVKIWSILLGGMTIVFLWLMFDLDLSAKKYQIENERMKRQLLEEKYQSLNEIYGRNAKLYHDLNNHLNLLWQLLDEGEIESAKTYISNISEPIRHMQKITWTGVDIVDAVLNSKLEVMQEKNMDYQIHVEFPPNTGILEIDICTILSNLLDNAIEAVEKLPRQEMPVKITMRSIKKMLFIQIENPCSGAELPEGGLPETSKKEKEKHGWGLRNISDIADKYQGTFQVESEKGTFCSTVMLFFVCDL